MLNPTWLCLLCACVSPALAVPGWSDLLPALKPYADPNADETAFLETPRFGVISVRHRTPTENPR
jgi:hypothetical protein